MPRLSAAAVLILALLLAIPVPLLFRSALSVTVGFIYDNDERTPYSYNFYLAQMELQKRYSGRVKTVMDSNVLEKDLPKSVERLVSKGCTIIFLTLKQLGRIIRPLERLAQAARQLSAGDYNVELGYAGDDEVGTLTRAFQQMAREMQAFVQDLNSKAYSDALTGVRNKGAFDICTRKLEESIRSADEDKPVSFALAMFDCNELKRINDSFGHEKGDLYLQTACRTICRTFAHSPVFRIGGDEFAVVLQREDLRNRMELERELVRRIQSVNRRAENEWEKVDIAWGIEEFDPVRDKGLETVLRRADERMYAHKKRLKRHRHGQ